MSHYGDGTRRTARPNPYRQEEPMETVEPLDAKEFAMLRECEQERHVAMLSGKGLRTLIYDLALEYAAALDELEKLTARREPQASQCADPDNHYCSCAHCEPDRTTQALEAMPAADLEMTRAARESRL